MTGICRRCGDDSPRGCEDWDCHLGWGPVDTDDGADDALEDGAA